MKLFILNTIRYSYKDYIKLLQDVFLYSEARTEPLRKSIKNDYVQLNKKLKYPYFSEAYLINYFTDKSQSENKLIVGILLVFLK